MQGSNRIYEEPSRLSQALVIGLSVAVVLMAGWFAATITLSQTATTSVEGATDAVAAGVPDASSGIPTTLRQSKRSIHFDWPAEFESPPPQPAPAQAAALPLAPELPPARGDMGRAPWPAAPDARDRSLDRSLLSRPPAAADATGSIVDVFTPPAPTRPAAAAPPPRQTPAPRRQKPRVVETDAAAQ